MSDARDIVQPRWKRRATEIAEAIGGGGSSSVTLDSNSINEIKNAFKEALYGTSAAQLSTFGSYVSNMGQVNQYSHPLSWEAAGHTLVNSVSGPNQGKFNDIPVTGNTLGITIPPNSTSLPVIVKDIDHNSGLVNPSLGGTPALRVNLMNSNAIQTTVTGHVQVKSAIDPANNNIIPMNVNVDQLPLYSNGNTKPVPIMSGSNFAGAVQTLQVREQNLIGTTGNGIKTTETAPVTSVSVGGTVGVNNHPTQIAVNNHPTQIAVNNHPSTMAVTGAVDVNNHPTQILVEPAVDSNNVKIPFSTTPTTTANLTLPANTVMNVKIVEIADTAAVKDALETAVEEALEDATGIDVNIVGNETYGIIMSKTWSGSAPNVVGDYVCQDFGLGANTQYYNQQGVNNSTLTFGWTIRVNGVDITNQDISLGLRGTTPTPLTTTMNYGQVAAAQPRLIGINSQAILDKYNGRRVTSSGVANVWIIEPLGNTLLEKHYGTVYATSGAMHKIRLDNGTDYGNAHLYLHGVFQNASSVGVKYIGARVYQRENQNNWHIVVQDAV